MLATSTKQITIDWTQENKEQQPWTRTIDFAVAGTKVIQIIVAAIGPNPSGTFGKVARNDGWFMFLAFGFQFKTFCNVVD
jgi:hypothetical protein